jgi:hypothetical protein
MDAKQPRSGIVPRRKVVASGLAALALAALPAQRADARIAMLRGMTGGGLASTEGGDEAVLVNFSVFASAIQFAAGNVVVLGSVRWIEAGSGLQLETTEVTVCRPMRERPDGAEIRGLMRVDGEGSYPFVLHAIDAGAPGSGLDTVWLEVNGPLTEEEPGVSLVEDGFVYDVAATLVGGDCQWIITDTEIDPI